MREIHNDTLTQAIIGCAIKVHKALGPGLLESAYEACLVYELNNQGLQVEQQKPLPVKYDNVQVECGYRLDIVVNDSIILELKSVESVLPIHKAQLLSYLRLSKKQIGLLINFNVQNLKSGISRIANKYEDPV